MFSLLLALLNNAYFISYIKSKTFDLPLSAKEERFYLEKKEQGDKNARDMLIEKNLRLVAHIAKKYNNNKDLQEDLISIGTIGLIKAIDSYSLDKKTKLATYASKCIENEILMHLRKNKKTKADVSFEESLSFDADGNELHLEDILGTEPDIVTKPLDMEIDKKILKEELEKLDERDRKIMILRYGLNGVEELTQKDVAEKLKISQSYISRIEKKVIKRLKNVIKI